MADLTRLCMDGFCSNVPVYVAGEHIVIDNAEISADLSNYYNKTQVDDLIAGLENVRIEVVQALPQEGETNVIYLVPKQGTDPDVYNEYVWIAGDPTGSFEKIGDTQVDLSNYYTKTEADALLNAKQNVLTAGDNITISGSTISAEEQEWTKDYPSLGEASQAVVQNDIENNVASGKFSLAEGKQTTASGEGAHAEGRWTEATMEGAHAEGQGTKAYAINSHAEGQNCTVASTGARGHAEGQECSVSGVCGHAEGYGSSAGGQESHAEGRNTVASGWMSHAEGNINTASGTCSHAGGINSFANSAHSHVMGSNLIANGHSQCVVGTGNIADTSRNNQYLGTDKWMFVVGNGSDVIPQGQLRPVIEDADRSNAMTVSRTGIVTATSFDNTSDERLKENFAEMDVQSAFMALEPVTFDWKEERPDGGKNMNNDGKRHFGLKAQQVESVLADNGFTDYGIVKDSGDYKTIAYTELIPICIKMIQDQQNEIERLKKMIEG